MSLSQDVRQRFEARVFKPGDTELRYRMLTPKKLDPNKRYPLVLFFHGSGERGDDNEKQLVHGMADFASDDVMAKHPCFVVAPQCPEELQWVDTPWTADAHSMPKEPTEPLRLSIKLVANLRDVLPVDESRIYVTGLSMGGFGAWDAMQRHPKLFAAAIPVCGGGDPAYAKHIAHVPIWAFHGDADTVVKTHRSLEMIAALKKAGGSPRYTEYENTGHNSWTATYANRGVLAWLFEQRKQ